jgi:thiol:disulfide interchange protein DsbD
MKQTIKDLGYDPEVVPSRLVPRASVDRSNEEIPEPVAAAVIKAGDTGKLVFLDFFAQWCGACKILDRTTLKDESVLTTLENFVFLKVDADQDPQALVHFNVVAMPTLVVLNVYGEEIYRHVGPIDARQLIEDLESLK